MVLSEGKVDLRFRAFGFHLLGSILVFACVLFLVFVLWYPAPLHRATGVFDVFVVILIVDVILGPLLTLIVFRAGKRTLAFDLVVIVLIQFSALFYGVWVVGEGRPAWIVFSGDRFELVQVMDIDLQSLDGARQEYRGVSWLGPRWVAASRPNDVQERNRVLFESVFFGVSLAQRPNLYRPLSDVNGELQKAARLLSELDRVNDVDLVQKTLKSWPEADSWVPLVAKGKAMVVLLHKSTAEVVSIVDLMPWNE